MSGITIYGRASSSNVQAVMWGLAELGLTCDRLDYGHRYGGLDSPEFRAMSPHGLVPVMRDDTDGTDLVMWESNAILRYLGARYGAAPLWPADPVARAPVDMWMEWGKTTLSQAFTVPIFWAKVRTAARDRDEAKLARALERFERLLDLLETELAARSYVAGDDFTLADVVLGHLFFRYYEMDIPRRRHPALAEWYARIAARPAFAEHVAIDYSELAVEGA